MTLQENTDFIRTKQEHTNNEVFTKPPQTKNQQQKLLNLGKLLTKKYAAHLQAHTDRNVDTNHVNYKIYYLLGNPYTFVNAYTAISKNKEALTKGIDPEETIASYFGIINAKTIANKFRTNSYQ